MFQREVFQVWRRRYVVICPCALGIDWKVAPRRDMAQANHGLTGGGQAHRLDLEAESI